MSIISTVILIIWGQQTEIRHVVSCCGHVYRTVKRIPAIRSHIIGKICRVGNIYWLGNQPVVLNDILIVIIIIMRLGKHTAITSESHIIIVSLIPSVSIPILVQDGPAMIKITFKIFAKRQLKSICTISGKAGKL